MTEVKVLLQGFPGKTSRGLLGFCNITLIKSDVTILFDTGFFSDRHLLTQKLEQEKIRPEDVEIVVLSHLHYDHCINVELFKKATVIVSKRELEYALSDEPKKAGDLYVSEHTARLIKTGRVLEAVEGLKLSANTKVIETPGHTPGSISLVVDGEKKTVITGDAVKNAWEFKNGVAEMFYGEKSDVAKSINKIKNLADFVIPGHDRSFFYDRKSGELTFYGNLDLQLYARLHPHIDQWTVFTISVAAP
ncbi:MAG: MBL fold metallo-hydrolase [Candidatus Bathyarchaeota archaeon]|nr:MBL fold metallo-hydrolase [Candidatus Bathyarchaeota archaeon]MDW8040356.1 MBL fold metallo-hydrolase [Nitrososphaerota archaeon]